MKTIEASGKTVEEALSNGLKELGCTLDEVTQEVIDRGSPGLFGMFGRLAKVRITMKEQEENFDFEMPTLTLDPEKEKKSQPQPKPQPKKAEKPQKTEKPEKPAEKPAEPEQEPEKETEAEKPARRAPKKDKAPRREKKPQPKPEGEETGDEMTVTAPAEPARVFPELNVEALSEDGKKAYEFISNLTKLMGVDVDIRMLEEENQIFIDINGDTLGLLIGRRGDTLDAIQYLTSLNVNKDKNDYTRVTIDVEHYRAKREETLRKLALRMANRARKSGRRVVLEPMNPYERRVLHSALQDNPYVQTHSEGEEPYRRVIITLK